MTDISKISDGTNTYNIKDATARTELSGKQDTLVSGTNIKTINGNSLLGSGNIEVGGNILIPYGESTSAADATQKEVTISSITSLSEGQIIIVKPTITSTVADSTLKLNNFTAYPMKYGSAAITTSTDSITWAANYPSWFRFDGSNWVFLGHGVDNNTTYTAMSVSEGTTGTKTTARSVRADYLKQIIQGTKLTGLSTSTNSAVVATDSITVGIGKLQAQVNSKQAEITSSNKLSASLVSDLATVATSGSYNDLSNKPTIPTVNNSTITIQKNSTTIDSFTTNASSGKTINITVPTNTNELTNGAGFITSSSLPGIATTSTAGLVKPDGTTITVDANGTISSASTVNIDEETITKNGDNELQVVAVKNKRDDSTLPIWQGTETQWNRGVATTWYYWQTNVQAMWTSGGNLPSSADWESVAYGDGKFVAIEHEFSSPIKAAYSTDGVNWIETTLSNLTRCNEVTYGDGKFVVVTGGNSDKSAYSTDGINWTASTLPSSANWMSVTYGDGKFIAVAYDSDKAAYSTDGGQTWTASTLPSSASWKSVTYGDGKFVAVDSGTWGSTKAAYSTDGINWIASTMPSSAKWCSVTYGDGKFVAVADSSDKAAYSTDGINWTASTIPSSAKWFSVTYGDGKFVAVAVGSNASAIFTVQYDKCYTDTANPTTNSTVYSAPEVTSSYTISSVTSGAITLSNNNTYYYNQSGNGFTYRTIGDAHPDWLSNINNVGVKIGNTIVATAGGSSSSYTAGNGIDITSNEISVTSDISTGAALGATAVQPSALATVATSGSYNDLSNKPTIPTVNNATLTIQKNGTNVATFTANASSNVTANISVPTNTNELTNGAGFITSSALSGYQTTTNLVTSVSSSSTDSQYPSAKLFYDTVGDIETVINTIRGV